MNNEITILITAIIGSIIGIIIALINIRFWKQDLNKQEAEK